MRQETVEPGESNTLSHVTALYQSQTLLYSYALTNAVPPERFAREQSGRYTALYC